MDKNFSLKGHTCSPGRLLGFRPQKAYNTVSRVFERCPKYLGNLDTLTPVPKYGSQKYINTSIKCFRHTAVKTDVFNACFPDENTLILFLGIKS
jgi:hypothetical protein